MDISVTPSQSSNEIQDALDNPAYATVTFAPGTYSIEKPFYIQRPVRVTGITPYQTSIYNTTSCADQQKKSVFVVRNKTSSPSSVGAIDVHISGFFLDSQGAPSIRIEYVQNVIVDFVTFQNGGIYVLGCQLFYLSRLLMSGGCGLKLDGSNGALLEGSVSDFLINGASPHGIEIVDSVDVVRIMNGEVNRTTGGAPGILVWNTSGLPSGKYCHLQHIYCTQNEGDSFLFQDTSEHRLYNCYSEGGPPLPNTTGKRRVGFRLKNSNRLYLNACRASSHGLAGFFLQDSSGCSLAECEAFDNGDAGFYVTAENSSCYYNRFSGCGAPRAGHQDYGFYFSAQNNHKHRGYVLSNCLSEGHNVANYGFGSVSDSAMRDCIDASGSLGNPVIVIRNSRGTLQ